MLRYRLKIVPVHVKWQLKDQAEASLPSGSVGNTQAVSGNSSLASADLTSAPVEDFASWCVRKSGLSANTINWIKPLSHLFTFMHLTHSVWHSK